MKYTVVGMKKTEETDAKKLEKRLKAAATGFLTAMREMRAATTAADRKFWASKANKFKSYLERLGKNK